MTYRTKVLTLSAVLAALLLVYGAGLFFSPERAVARAEATALFKGKTADAASLVLSGPGAAPLAFAKEGGAWVLKDGQSGLPVNQSKVEALLRALAGVNRLSPRSESAAALESFGLGKAEAKEVLVKSGAGKVLASFALGSLGPTGKEVYLRQAGSGPVLAADASIVSYVTLERRAWLDLRVLATPPKAEDVQGLTVSANLSLEGKKAQVLAYAATRKDGGWVSPTGKFEAVSVESVLRSALNLQAEDIVALPPPEAFSKVQGRVELSLSSGQRLVLEIGAPAGQDRFYLRGGQGAWVYTVSTYSLQALLRLPQLTK